MPTTIQIKDSGHTPARIRQAYFEAAREQMAKAMIAAEAEVRRLVPVKTGHLRRSLTHTVQTHGSTIVGYVGTNVQYGLYLDQGTGLYGPKHQPIVPVKAKALRFPAPGDTTHFSLAGRKRRGKAGQGATYVYAASVKGVKPMRFFERGFEASKD